MNLTFILVEPAVEENIGAAARAIKTMGIKKLTLVNPQCNHLGENAKKLAHGSTDILEQALVYQDLLSAIQSMDFVIGTSSKKRKTHADHINGKLLPEFLITKSQSIKNAALVFGREESGLGNPELKLCDVLTYLPLVKAYPSLNLGQAVMLYSYLLSPLQAIEKKPVGKNNMENLKSLKKKVTGILEFTDINNRDIIVPRILERLSFLEDDDIQLMHSFCNAFIKKFLP